MAYHARVYLGSYHTGSSWLQTLIGSSFLTTLRFESVIFSLNILTWYIYKPVYIRLMPSNGRLISSIISVALEAQRSVFLRCFSEVDLISETGPI